MEQIDVRRIEREARALRAQELQRLQNLFAERMSLYAVLLGNSLLGAAEAAGNLIRPLLTWNPQDAARSTGPTLGVRLNRAARALFAWNPQRKRSC